MMRSNAPSAGVAVAVLLVIVKTVVEVFTTPTKLSGVSDVHETRA
jgi:hypothetical protein